MSIQQYVSVPFLAPYDYFLYIDTYDSNKIKARNKYGRIEFSHATDFGNVFNSCVNALSSGGDIHLDSGTFLTTTGCILKNFINVVGQGPTTIIKLANGVNNGTHVFSTPNVDSMAGTNDGSGVNVIHGVTLQNFVIDGNKANNPTGGCGLKKYAYNWVMTNLQVHHTKSHGIMSEWGFFGGAHAEVGGVAMSDHNTLLYVWRPDAKGIYWRGPHDSQFDNCLVYGSGLENWHIQSGTGFSGGSSLTQCHTYTAGMITPSDSLFIDNSFCSAVNLSLEGAHGGGKASLHLTQSAKLVGANIWCFASDVGMQIDSDFNHIQGYISGVDDVGCSVQGDHNNIDINIVDMVDTGGFGLVVGAAGAVADFNRMRVRTSKINDIHLSWDNASNSNNSLELVSVVDTGETDCTTLANINQVTNNFKAYSIGPGTKNLTTANPALIPYTNVGNTFTEPQIIKKDAADILLIQRNNNGALGGGIAFNLGTTGTGNQYAKLYAFAVTASPLVGKVAIWLPNNSSPVEKFLFEADGSLTQNALAKLSPSGLTALRTFTFPDATTTLLGADTTQTVTSKTVNATNNTITDTSTALGDILASNGTKFVRKARGTALQVLRVNSGATDVEYASLDSERVGKATASGNASATVFNIAHGLGSNPTYAFATCSSITNLYTYTTDATNIIVTFATAPASGTNNVVIYWRVVA